MAFAHSRGGTMKSNQDIEMQSDQRFGADISLLRSILDSLVDGIISIDLDGALTVFNEAAARLMGVPKEQALGKHLLAVIPNAGLVNVLRTGEPEMGRTQLIGQRTVLTNRSPIIHSGVMIGAVSQFQDITEMEKISRELDSTKTIVRTLEEILSGSGELLVPDRRSAPQNFKPLRAGGNPSLLKPEPLGIRLTGINPKFRID